MHPYQTGAALAVKTLYVLLVAALFLAVAVSPLNAQADVQTALNGTARQAYNSQESVLVSSSMQSGAVVPTQPTWSPLLIDQVVAPGTPPPNGVYAQPLWAKDVSAGVPACNPCDMVVVAALGGGLYAFNASTGATVWSRNTQTSGGANTTNYFWYDDCNSTGSVSYPPNIALRRSPRHAGDR